MYKKSKKLDNVCYDIRGPVLDEAARLEEEGHEIIRLNIGNTAPFGLNAPEEIIQDVILNLREAQGYCASQGLFSARKAIMQETQRKGIFGVGLDDIYIGNGVSELISLSLQALLNNGDEILIPAPDYPLWTAAATLAGGKVVHYFCDEQADWYPDLEDIRSKITPRTRGLVLINPNNPTGSLYPEEVLNKLVEIARQNDLILFSDEIYEKIVYEDRKHVPTALLSEEVLCLSFNGLSKAYRVPGFRAGWMMITGRKNRAKDYIEGIRMLSNMRLCSNVPAQLAIQTALGGYQSIVDLVSDSGRLRRQRDLAVQRINEIPGLSCRVPQGALYLFPRVDTKKFKIDNDERLILDILTEERVLMVQGTAFNWPEPDHFRLVFMPPEDILCDTFDRLERFFETYTQER